jgi:hypothetical protein
MSVVFLPIERAASWIFGALPGIPVSIRTRPSLVSMRKAFTKEIFTTQRPGTICFASMMPASNR